MSLSTAIVVVLLLLFLSAFPKAPWSKKWGSTPFNVLGLLLIVLVLLVVLGRLS